MEKTEECSSQVAGGRGREIRCSESSLSNKLKLAWATRNSDLKQSKVKQSKIKTNQTKNARIKKTGAGGRPLAYHTQRPGSNLGTT